MGSFVYILLNTVFLCVRPGSSFFYFVGSGVPHTPIAVMYVSRNQSVAEERLCI